MKPNATAVSTPPMMCLLSTPRADTITAGTEPANSNAPAPTNPNIWSEDTCSIARINKGTRTSGVAYSSAVNASNIPIKLAPPPQHSAVIAPATATPHRPETIRARASSSPLSNAAASAPPKATRAINAIPKKKCPEVESRTKPAPMKALTAPKNNTPPTPALPGEKRRSGEAPKMAESPLENAPTENINALAYNANQSGASAYALPTITIFERFSGVTLSSAARASSTPTVTPSAAIPSKQAGNKKSATAGKRAFANPTKPNNPCTRSPNIVTARMAYIHTPPARNTSAIVPISAPGAAHRAAKSSHLAAT